MQDDRDSKEERDALRREFGSALLMERIVRAAYENKHSTAIQPLQWSILRYLDGASLSERDISTISRHVGLTSSPVSRAIGALERRGYLKKGPHPRSKRSVAVTLSPKGLAILQSDPILKVARLLRELPEGERGPFARVLGKLALKLL